MSLRPAWNRERHVVFSVFGNTQSLFFSKSIDYAADFLKMQTELGIDEAGRGPVLGPMVLAGVRITPDAMPAGDWVDDIQDSKNFGSGKTGKQRRAVLAEKIKAYFPHRVVVVSTTEIDAYVSQKSLNLLEQQTAQKIIAALPANRVRLDGYNLFKPITTESIQAYNKADSLFLSVSAASILAKNERDLIMARFFEGFEGEYGIVKGGGYANSATLRFIQWYREKYGCLPEVYRTSYQWKALQKEV